MIRIPLLTQLLFVLVLGACVPAPARADEPIVKTQHKARIDSRTYSYTVEAGRLPIRHMETGEIHGRMFYVAYRLSASSGKPRPVMFSWGGGPSGPALDMQMVYGPKKTTDEGRIVDNALSLLSVADLVFVDPIGTGFSRPEKADFLPEFYSTIGDARSVSEFIRVWIATHDAENAPLYLTGQSYGVWRASIAAEILEKAGRRVDGIILTSGGMGLADEFSDRAYEVAYRVPDYAVTAFYHHRLAEEYGRTREEVWDKAVTWASDVYGPALSRIGSLTDAEREAVAAELARRTGYPLDKIDRGTLTFSVPEYRRDFFGEDGKRLNIFDMRRIDGSGEPRTAGNDAEDRTRAHYLRDIIGYKTDLAYLGLEQGYMPATEPDYRPIGFRWNYNSGTGESGRAAAEAAGQGPPGKEPWVRRTIEIDPGLQVFVEAAVFDSLNHCAANEDRKRRMPPDLADNFELHCYFAGHGSFRDPEAYPHVMRDMRSFILRTSAR